MSVIDFSNEKLQNEYETMKGTLQNMADAILYGLLFLISLFPMKLLYGITDVLGVAMYRIVGYRRNVVVQNIVRAFPEMNYEQIECVAGKFYSCFTSYFAEIEKNISIHPKKLRRKLTFENTALIDWHINNNRNVILCMGHCGNWEMLNFMPVVLKHDTYAIYKQLQSSMFDRIMVRIRSRFGLKLIRDKSVARHIMSTDNKPGVYMFLADQRPRYKNMKYRYDLLGQTTFFHSGMERLARISHSAIVYVNIAQKSKGHYHATFINICDDASLSKEGEPTKQYANLLTSNIKEEPYGWLWSHKRWKSMQ